MPKIFGNLCRMDDTLGARDYERLARVVRERREHVLELRQDQLAHGPSTTTMSDIENSQPVSPASYRKLEASMGWTRGSAEVVLRGGEPALLPSASQPRVDRAVDLRNVSDGALIAELVDRLAERHAYRLGGKELSQSDYVGGRVRGTLPGGGRHIGDGLESAREPG